jgi:iron complex outermembrane receptor protein
MPLPIRRADSASCTRRHRILPAALVAVLAVVGPSWAQSTADLTRISVEDLMGLEVTSVSKKERPLGKSPAAVFVLTHDDIRRSGMTSLPELLRLVPGLHVARIDGSKWAVTSRGFNGRFANKLLVLVDGRTVYSPLYSGVYWDEVDLPLEDIARVEVIRGPGATMWGANAVNGVINVITKDAADTTGTAVSLSAGSEERLAATVRYGGRSGDALTWRLWGKAFDRGPLARADGSSAYDGWRMGRTGFRADYRASERDTLTLQGDLHNGREDQTSGTLMLVPPYRRLFDEQATVKGHNAVGRWSRTHSERSESSVQVFFDHTDRAEYLLDQHRTTVDLDVQHRQALGARHDIVFGGGYRRGRTHLTNSEMVRFADPDRREWLASVFAEDEIALVPEHVTLTLGMKVERNTYTGVELQPNVRALWAVSSRDSIWAAVTRGVRTPSLLENGANVDIAAAPGPQGLPIVIAVIGNGTPQAERLWAAEAGYRRHWSRVSLDVSAFRNDYAHLLSLTQSAPQFVPAETPFLRLPYIINADLVGVTHGVEALGTWRARDGWTLTGSYTFLDVALTSNGAERDLRYEASEDDSPRHQATLRSLASIGARWEADVTLQALASSDTGNVPAYRRLDTRLGYKVSPRLTISLAALNLLDSDHAEFVSVLNEEVTQPRRSVVLRTAWTF